MAEISNFYDIVAVPLTVDSYGDWFRCVRNYLISQDLWEVTNGSCARQDENGTVEDHARWRRNNAAALHVIDISCGAHNLPLIREASEAKDAWDILYGTYNNEPPPPRSPPQEELEMGSLYKAIHDNNWSEAEAFIGAHRSALDPELANTTGETPLHVAIKLGLVDIVEKLVRLVPAQYLEIPDDSGFTPLLTAATYSGVIPIAKCLIDKNSNALTIPATGGQHLVPVVLAAVHGYREMKRYLYSVTPLCAFSSPVGPLFLENCLVCDDLDIFLHLLHRDKELLFAANQSGYSTIESIASCLPNYLNKMSASFWMPWVSHYIQIPSTINTKDFCLDIRQEGKSNEAHHQGSICTIITYMM